MCRIGKSNINYELIVNDKVVKSFKSKKALNIYVREFEINNHSAKVGVINEKVS